MLWLKALHLIFMVTWFAGLFYLPRLYVYHAQTEDQAGRERFKIMDNESEAKQLANKRARINREQTNRATKRISLDEIGRRLALGTFKELNLIVKGDVDGSVEALSDSLIKQSVETIQVNVIHKAVGQIILIQ